MPPHLTHILSLFQKIHVYTMIVSHSSNGCKHVVHGWDALSFWSEACALRHENVRTLGEWFFDDIICRWGCSEEVVMNNASHMKNMLQWLENKYGICGIQISPYNSQANGKIKCAHLDLRQALTKVMGGDISRWYYFLKHVLWVDRVTSQKGLGCTSW